MLLACSSFHFKGRSCTIQSSHIALHDVSLICHRKDFTKGKCEKCPLLVLTYRAFTCFIMNEDEKWDVVSTSPVTFNTPLHKCLSLSFCASVPLKFTSADGGGLAVVVKVRAKLNQCHTLKSAQVTGADTKPGLVPTVSSFTHRFCFTVGKETCPGA